MGLIRTATDARRLAPGTRALVSSPPAFDGTLEAFAVACIVPNLPSPACVEDFHRALVAYVAQPDPLLLVRAVSMTDRRHVYTTGDGTRFRATDNSPAWWTHAALAQGYGIAPGAFGDVIATMPAHLFDVAATSAPTANAAGWHIAHLFDVKDRATDYRAWRRADVIGRFVRNVHPCNYFLLAKPAWQRWGAESAVLAYFAALYASRYASVWDEFVHLARAEAGTRRWDGASVPYAYAAAQEPEPGASTLHANGTVTTASGDASTSGPRVVEYRASRLTFKRDVIEALADDDGFRVMTPVGTFALTKAEFYHAFPRVPHSRSYRDVGVYHYPTVPAAAEPFRVDPR